MGSIINVHFIWSTQNINVSSGQKSQSDSKQIPHLDKQGSATRLVVEGKPLLLISGELHNSTCGGFDYMRPVWEQLAKKNLNCVIASVSWELIEPEKGKYTRNIILTLFSLPLCFI